MGVGGRTEEVPYCSFLLQGNAESAFDLELVLEAKSSWNMLPRCLKASMKGMFVPDACFKCVILYVSQIMKGGGEEEAKTS